MSACPVPQCWGDQAPFHGQALPTAATRPERLTFLHLGCLATSPSFHKTKNQKVGRKRLSTQNRCCPALPKPSYISLRSPLPHGYGPTSYSELGSTGVLCPPCSRTEATMEETRYRHCTRTVGVHLREGQKLAKLTAELDVRKLLPGDGTMVGKGA